MVNRVLDTFESRMRHSGRVHYGRHVQLDRHGAAVIYRGWRYRCPRCAWKSQVRKSRIGAQLAADRHALDCRPTSIGASPR